MKRLLSFCLANRQTAFAKLLQSSLIAFTSTAILTQSALAQTFYFDRAYQESGYNLRGEFTANDFNLDDIISAEEVTGFEAFLENKIEGWKESIDLLENKKIVELHYDIKNSLINGSPDFKFQVDTIPTNNSPTIAAFTSIESADSKDLDTNPLFPDDKSWKVDFTGDADFFRVNDYILLGQDPNKTGIVTFIEDNGGSGAKTPEASNLAAVVLGAIFLLKLKARK